MAYREPDFLPVQPPAPPAPPTSALRILVVDDNAAAADAMGDLLDAYGFTATVVMHDPLAALARAQDERFDICLLDIGMPGLDGHGCARRLRADPRHAGSLLIALTAYGQDEDRERSRQAGFDYHFVKPAKFVELLAVLMDAACGQPRRQPRGRLA